MLFEAGFFLFLALSCSFCIATGELFVLFFFSLWAGWDGRIGWDEIDEDEGKCMSWICVEGWICMLVPSGRMEE